jgi:putative transposase
MINTHKIPPLEIRLQVLSAVDYAPGDSIRARIQSVATRTFIDKRTDNRYQFTWRTISTWLYRFKKHGITTLDNKTRRDKNTYCNFPTYQSAIPRYRANFSSCDRYWL